MAFLPHPISVPRVHRRQVGKFGRNLDHRLVDEHRHGVEIGGVGLQPQPLRLQRDRAAAGKGVVQTGQFVGVEKLCRLRMLLVECTDLPPGAADFGAGPLQHLLVGGVLPRHQLFEDLEKPLAFDRSVFFVHAVFETATLLVARIVDHLCKNDSACSRQRTSRPPKMQRARMAVANRFFSGRRFVDGIERQRHFNQFARRFDRIAHRTRSPLASSACKLKFTDDTPHSGSCSNGVRR